MSEARRLFSPSNRDAGELPRPAEDPPPYSRAIISRRSSSQEPQLHEFSLEGSDRRAWAYLRFRSWAPSSRSLPVFLEEQSISGQVDLDLRRPKAIKAVEISVRGVVRTQDNELAFYSATETLWNGSRGDPRSPLPPGTTNFSEKLSGAYSWRFSISLPHEIRVGSQIAGVLQLNPIERLPPNVDGPDGNTIISYFLTVSFKIRGILKHDKSISTSIGYTPITQPDPPSASRSMAYRTNIPIPGPDLDPVGWRTLHDIDVKGTLFTHQTHVTYTLAFATPLAYTIGTVVPCHLTVKTSDEHALDLLSTPSAIQVTLRRRITAPRAVRAPEMTGVSPFRQDQSQPLSKASWLPWGQVGDRRILMGELSVPLSCTPTFNFGIIKLEYFIDVHPPVAPGFHPSNESVLSSTPIQIVSGYAEGSPRPRAYISSAQDAARNTRQTSTVRRQTSTPDWQTQAPAAPQGGFVPRHSRSWSGTLHD